MNLKKRIIAVLVTVGLCISIASCSSSKNQDEETEEPLVAETVEEIAEDLRADYTEDETAKEKIEELRASFADLRETDALAFTVSLENGKITVTGYTGSDSSVRVPTEIQGLPVTAIADAAFAGKSTLKKLYLPDSVQAIGEGILSDCSSLTALRTPLLGADDSAEQFLGYLFGAEKYIDNPSTVPPSLEYLELGGDDQKLADYALFDCNDLICVMLPSSMTELGSYSLYYCGSLLAINTEHLTKISAHALDSCFSLTVLELGANLTSVGIGALEGCIGLRNLTLPFIGGSATANTYLGYVFGAETPDFSKGYYPPYLTSVTLLSTCKQLGNYAFFECESLLSVTLPDSLQTVGVRAFAGCLRLTQLQIPESVTEIRENACFGCISLENVTFEGSSKLATIGVNAFYRCSALRSVTLPKSLKEIPASCFADCLNLEFIDLGGAQAVGKNAFRHCQSLNSLVALPEVTFEEGNRNAEALLNQDK